MTSSSHASERRRHQRRKVIDSFSLFVSVPQKSVVRLPVHDLAEGGIGFDLDIPGEPAGGLSVQVGDLLQVQLYLNQSLHIDLSVRVARVELRADQTRQVGAEFADQKTSAYRAYTAFLGALDHLIEGAKL